MKTLITRAAAALLLLALALSGLGSVCAAEEQPRSYRDIPGVTQKEIEAIDALIAEHGFFSYGHLYETEAFVLPDGSFAGFTIELCKLLSELFGAEFRPVFFDEWSLMKEALDDRSIDFTSGFSPTEERRKTYVMTTPIAGRSLRLYTLKDSTVTSAEALNGARIGALYGSALLDAVMEHYPGYTFEAVDFTAYAEAVALLERGEIDAIIATSAADPKLAAFDTIVANEFFTLAYYPISISSADRELAPIISVLDKYIRNGGYAELFELYENSAFAFRQNSLLLSLTPEEQDYLDHMLTSGQKVNIGLQHDAYPASFYNDAEREFQGVSIDILAEIARLTGLTFEPLSTSETTTLATILEKLKTGEISMMTQLLRTESRKNDYIWSDIPYLTTNYALLSKLDYPEVEIYQVPRARVGTVYKSAHEVMFETWFPQHPNRIIYDTTNEAFNALERGDIDLLMLSENMLLQQTNLRQRTGFKVNVKFDVSLDSFFGFSKSEDTLRSIVDKSMGYIKLDAIAGEWMNKVFDYESEIARVRSIYLMCIAGLMLLALLGTLLLLLKNKRLGRHLLSQTTLLSAIYRSLPDTVFSKDTEGVYTSCNLRFELQAGMPEREVIGKTYAEVFGRMEGAVTRHREIDQKILDERSISLTEEEVLFSDGSRHLLEVLEAPLIQNDSVVGIIGIGRDVTERREMQSRLDSIINTAQIAFILTVDGIITEANRYCMDYVGMKLGDDIRNFYAKPEQRDEVLALTERYGTITNWIIHIRIASGEVRRFLTSVMLTEYETRKAHIVWALDIEEDEKRSDLLRETQLSFQTVLDSLPMPVRIVDLESHNLVYVNPSLLELLEYDSPEELCGRSVLTIVPEILSDGTPFVERGAILNLDTPRPVVVDMEYLTKTGRVIESVVASRIIDYKGRRSSIGIIKDLTEEKRMAQILREAAEREKEANQAKSLFLASMSHEIRTPMNGIIGMTDLLLGENLETRQLQYAKDIKASAESLLGIINDILDLSKITEGKLQITPVDIDLTLLLKNTVSMMRFSARSKGLGLIDDIQLGTHEYVRVDDVRLKQILINLLSNAIKFTKRGFVKLAVEIKDSNLFIKVTDTGIGIKKEDLALIFSAFEQADLRRNRALKGTGLGLSITKNLVELMGGRIWVESKYEVGTTFFVTIPYVPGDEAAVEVGDTMFEYIFAPTAQVLLVDDIQNNLTVGSGLLRLCGITADVALSGYEAIDYIKTRDYDLVFMDHMMPEMDGVEVANLIRSLGGKYENLPIVALTANVVGESRALLLSSGMDDFLSKPIDKTEMVAILKKWLPPEKIKTTSTADPSASPLYTEALLAASRIEGIDIDLALNRLGGLNDVLERSIRQTAFSIDEKLKDMDNCLARSDLQGFAMDAHGLKGALANIGATKYAELAATLEIAARAENIPLCVDDFSVFVSAMRSFSHALRACFSAADAAEKPAGDPTLLQEQLRQARDLLDTFEATEALDCLNRLSDFSFGKQTDELLERARDAAGRYNYSEALLLLGEIEI